MNARSSSILCLLVLIACGAPSDDQVPANIERARRSFAAFNEHDWVKQASFFSDTCRYLDPSYGPGYRTLDRKSKADKHRQLQAWSRDVRDDITAIFGSDDRVVVQFTSSGTARKDSADVPWSLPLCTVFTFQDGLIVVDETYYDR